MGNKKQNKLIKLMGLFFGVIGLYEVLGKMLWNFEQSGRFKGVGYTIVLTLFSTILALGAIFLLEMHKNVTNNF